MSYKLRDKDKLVLTGKQLREFKKEVIKEYKSSEYPATAHRRFRRQGFIEAVDGLKQWIINEGTLNPEPCCHGVRICNIISKLDEWKKQGDKRFVIDQNHIDFIKHELESGISKNQIAKDLGVSISTIVYWTNPKYRRRKMEKNAKIRFGKRLKPLIQEEIKLIEEKI